MADQPSAFTGIWEAPVVDPSNEFRMTDPWYEAIQRTSARANSGVQGSGTPGGLAKWDTATSLTSAALSGDASTPTNSTIVTLANSGVTAGTYGDATHVSQVTVDAKGRVTAAADVAISSSVTPPGGANTDIQYNDAGAFGGDANLTWDKVNKVLTASGGTVVSALGASHVTLVPSVGVPNILLGGVIDGSGNDIPDSDFLPYVISFADPSFFPGARQAGISIDYGLTPGSPDTFAQTVSAMLIVPTDTSGAPVASWLVQTVGAGTGAVPGATVIAARSADGSGAAGTIGGQQLNGTAWFIWQDHTGAMRYGPARPTEDNSVSDTSGTLFATGSGSGASLPTICAIASLRA